MSDAILWILIGFLAFLFIRRIALSYISRSLQKKVFEREYVSVLQSAQFKVKGKYE